MTAVILPIPKTALGTTYSDEPEKNGVEVRINREWFRLLELIIKAIGGDTGGPIEIALEESLVTNSNNVHGEVSHLAKRLASLEAALAIVQAPGAQQRLNALEAFIFGGGGRQNLDAAIKGTANQITVTRSGNAYVLSTPQDIATTSSVQFGVLGLGMAPTNILDITQTQNATSTVKLLNASSGNSARASIQASASGAGTGSFSEFLLSNGTSLANVALYGASFTTSGMNRQDGMQLAASGTGGLSIQTIVSQPIYFGVNNTEVGQANATEWVFKLPIQVPSYIVSGVPSASPAAQIIYVSDETGGAVLAFSNGSNWLRVTDRAIIS